MAETIEADSRDAGEGTSARRIARVYAEALLDVAEQKSVADLVGEELNGLVGEMFKNAPDIKAALANPVVKGSAKKPVIEAAFRGKVSDLLADFINVLNNKNRLGLIEQVAPAYRDLLDERAKRFRVRVKSAVPMTAEQTEHLRQTLGHAYGREPIIETQVDDSLLGGLVVQIGDDVFDSSVRTRVDNIRNQLLARSSHEIQVGRDRFSSN